MATSRPVAPGSVARGGAAEQVGRVLGGRYRLLAPIGTGASADVYVAEDVVLRRRVAVKILHRGLAEDEGFLRRFRAEAQAAAALNHPNVMKVFDSGEDDGGPYLVLEYLSGGSLRDMLDAGHRLTPSQALLVGLEAARALDYAHRRGLVHRDIKPANLLFDDEGRLRIADFGLARALAEAAWTEPAGAVLGTARYAAPEQAQAQPLDGRADVYSLALVLVECVTGSVPFAADTTVATLMARIDKPLVAPRQLGVLGPIVEAAGTPDPTGRLDAADLVRSLDRVAGDLPAPDPLPIVGESRPHVLDTVAVDRTELAPARAPSNTVADEEPPGVELVADPARRRRWPVRVLVVALLLVLALASAALTARLATPSHTVPTLRNLTVAQARQQAQSAELEIAVAGAAVFDEEIPEGKVVRQDPPPGEELREGKPISIVLSKGPEPRTVPDLTGLTEEQAKAAVEGKQLAVEFARDYSETINKGHVVAWEPKGSPVPRGGVVTVTISEGPEPRTLPDVSGQSFDEAAQKLRDMGLDPKRADVFDDEVPAGKVVGTRPGPGQQVERGASVTVNVSKGPDLITVPDVSGMEVDQAVERMEATGLRVVDVEGPPRKKVYASDPAAGSKVKRGAEVTLYTR